MEVIEESKKVRNRNLSVSHKQAVKLDSPARDTPTPVSQLRTSSGAMLSNLKSRVEGILMTEITIGSIGGPPSKSRSSSTPSPTPSTPSPTSQHRSSVGMYFEIYVLVSDGRFC